MNTTWTKFSERLPEGIDGPIWCHKADTRQTHCFRTVSEMRRVEPLWESYTHWMMADAPELPKEEAQEEKDERAFMDFIYKAEDSQPWAPYARGAWRAALRYERAEVAKDWAKFVEGARFEYEEFPLAIKRLRKRVGLDK